MGTAARDWPRLATWGVALTLTVGVLWRLGRYLAQFPIWGDEAFILLNLLDLDYLGLVRNLKYAQVAPLLFLWTEETALNLLGRSELALRLASVLASLGGLVLFWRLCRHTLAPLPGMLAIGFFAVSYFPVRHGCEVKPYAFDLLCSMALYTAALAWLRQPERLGRLALLALIVPLTMVASYPAVFAAGTIGIVLLPAAWRGGWGARGLYVLYGVLLLASFLGHYELVGRKQASPEEAQAVHDFMRTYWRDSFPPHEAWRWPLWLIDVHTGNMFAYPMGGKNGASAISFALCVLGIAALWRQRNHALLALCLLPFGLTLLAAILGRYPYGGSARVAQHLAAPICLLLGVGAAAVLGRLRSVELQERWGFAVCVLLAGFGVAGLAYDWAKPYKTLHDWEVRKLARELGEQVRPGGNVLLCNHPSDVAAEMQWYLRNERWSLRWLDRDPYPDMAAPQVWLLYFDAKPAAEESVIGLLHQHYPGWSPADCRHAFVPAENNVSQACYCTHLRLVPPLAASRSQDAASAKPQAAMAKR